MLEKIAPGARINVKITKPPTNAAATKTLVKLLSKDPAVRAENQRIRIARKANIRPIRRGGRQWLVRPVKQRPVKGTIGESGTLVATLDVLTELKSVSRFIEVSRVR